MKKKLFITLLFCLALTTAFSQVDTAANKKNTLFKIDLDKAKSVLPKREIVLTEATYKGGMNNFYAYFAKNFNFNNVTIDDIPEAERNLNTYMIYLICTIDSEGKPTEFAPVNTTANSSFYKESVRVISSSRWVPAKTEAGTVKRSFVIPVRVFTEDLK